jgi:nucleotide-binding universal stress UspA family protein
MFKRILVPIDGSETSNQALRTAITLAGESSASLHIVHICDNVPIHVSMDTLPYPPAEVLEAQRNEGERILGDALASARAANIEADSKLIIINSPGRHISDAIEQESGDWEADLIVIGTHGRRGFRRLLLGSVAENLIRVARKPVMLIRGAKSRRESRRALRG